VIQVLLRNPSPELVERRARHLEQVRMKWELFPVLLEQHLHALAEMRRQKARERRWTPIVLVDDGGKVIDEFPSIGHAAAEYGIPPDSIREQIRRGGYLRNGMRFARAGEVGAPKVRRHTAAIRRLSAGRVFPSIVSVACGRASGPQDELEYDRLWTALQSGRRYRGELYEYVDRPVRRRRRVRHVVRVSDGRRFWGVMEVVEQFLGEDATLGQRHTEWMRLKRAIVRGKPYRGEEYVHV
jgi:hypothetical protein